MINDFKDNLVYNYASRQLFLYANKSDFINNIMIFAIKYN